MITDYEAGSGSLYIPILGDLFPKLWGQKMKEIKKYKVILNGTTQQIEKDLFESVNEGVKGTVPLWKKTGSLASKTAVRGLKGSRGSCVGA